MNSKLLIYVSLANENSAPAEVGLGDAVSLKSGWRVWLLSAGEQMIREVCEAVLSGRITSAYIGTRSLPDDELWLAAEWHGRIVADTTLANELEQYFVGWKTEPSGGSRILVYSPSLNTAGEVTRAKFRKAIDADGPLFVDADLRDILENPAAWFGDYGRDDFGGWVTLVSAAVQTDEWRVRLGNFAAIGLRVDRNDNGLWSIRRSGAVRVTALGLTRNQLVDGDLPLSDFKLPLREFDQTALDESPASYCVAVQIEAPVDPKVIIGSGTVFEQSQPGQAQNLAVASEWHETIDAGQIIGVVLPAWCLNKNLPPPAGEPVRLTPLAFVGDSADQGRVWADVQRRRSMGESG